MRGLFVLVLSLLSVHVQAETCKFNLTENSIKVGWTAYKTTEKVAVVGTFKNVTVKGGKPTQSLADLAQSIEVTVDPLSVDSGNPARDLTVTEYFFKKLAPKISGKIKSFNKEKKEFVLTLNFNKKIKDVTMKYEVVSDSQFKGVGSFDLMDFNSKLAHDSIHKQCFELHKGKDGVSKTWTEVQISIEGEIKKICQ